eukprot:SAG22_NODE_12988_length_422_cov_1.594427_1_plen_140_part_11
MEMVAAACGRNLDECLEMLAERSTAPAAAVGQHCAATFLGPDLGWSLVQAVDPDDGMCRTDMDVLTSLCEDDLDECITYLSLGNSSNSVGALHLSAAHVTEVVWFLTKIDDARVLDPGLHQRLFVAGLREDVATASGIPF